MSEFVVTLDGPGGTGKSTVSKVVARRVGWPHLDTGAFYRAATLAVLRAGVDPGDEDAVEKVTANVVLDQREGVMYLDGEDVSQAIRTESVTGAVSAVSANRNVRRLLVEMQRDWVDRRGGKAVVEGRDIGSVVFPAASLKVYLDARQEVRASRRALQEGHDPDAVIRDLERRDRLDSTRPASPLSVPEGAVIVDTSDMSFDEVVDRIVELIDSRS